MEFKVGDIVSLKSGGPKMTIKKIETVRYVGTEHDTIIASCNWFDKEQLQSKSFPLETLVLNND